MKHMTTRAALSSIMGLLAIAGCSLDADEDDPEPEPGTYCAGMNPIASGGSTGPVAGPATSLLVCVVEPDDVRTGVANARVTLETGEEGFTDASGMVKFPTVTGARSISVDDPRFVPTTWEGITGDTVTMFLERNPPQLAAVSGTIDGWDALPAPGLGHYLVAEVQFTRSPAPLVATDALLDGQTANHCYRWDADPTSCAWSLVTRSGAQRWIATLVDADANGTPDDTSDDRFTVIGYAASDTVSVDGAAPLTGVVLARLPPEDLSTITVELAEPAPGLGQRVAIPTLELPDGQRIVFSFPPLTFDAPSSIVIRNADTSFTGRYHIEERASAPGTTTPYAARGARDIDPTLVAPLDRWSEPLTLGRTGPRTWRLGRSDCMHVAHFTRDGAALWNLVAFGMNPVIEPPSWVPLGTGRLQIDVTTSCASTSWSTTTFEYRDLARGPTSGAGARVTFEEENH
jgi:hypothetical protein